jgi:hypothetical protein
MTAVQAGDIRFLGGYIGGMFMAASKVLGEEGVSAGGDPGASARGASNDKIKKSEEEEEEERGEDDAEEGAAEEDGDDDGWKGKGKRKIIGGMMK